MADMRALFGDTFDVGMVKPDTVTDGQVWAHKAEFVDVFEGRAVTPPLGVFLLSDTLSGFI